MKMERITYCENVALVTLHNIPCDGLLIGNIFTEIARTNINVDMISQTAPQGGSISIAFTVSMASVGGLLPILNGFKPESPELSVELTTGMTKLNFYDSNMVHAPGIAAQVFTALSLGGVSATMITTSTVDISLLIPVHQESIALELCESAWNVIPSEVEFD